MTPAYYLYESLDSLSWSVRPIRVRFETTFASFYC